jgi:hypothetical protein
MNMLQAEEHLSDADLVRALDGELDRAGELRADAHMAACAGCAQRLQRLGSRAAQLSSLMLETDFDVPAAQPPASRARVVDLDAARARRARRIFASPSLRVAAAVMLLLGITLGVTPVRAWITDWVQQQWSRLTDTEPASEPVRSPTGPDNPVAGARVQFVPDGPEFRVELQSAQEVGAIDVAYHDQPFATAETSGTAAELLVLTAGVRVMNEPGSAATYTVRVPHAVGHVVVISGGRTLARLDADQLARGQTLPLGAP